MPERLYHTASAPFEAARRVDILHPGHRAARLRGHSYLVRLRLTAALDQVMGWTVDYGDVKEVFQPTYRALDHHTLNDLPGLADADPGSLARWLRARVLPALPQLDRIDLQATPGCGAVLSWGEQGPALPT
jgi:6-pyruvoyltetrahydropterin/6-carboxytetrahydropterin synthase